MQHGDPGWQPRAELGQTPAMRAPTNTPARPPSKAKRIEPSPIAEPPQSSGRKLPTVPPTIAQRPISLRSTGRISAVSVFALRVASGQPLRQERQAEQEAAVDAAVAAVEELEVQGVLACAGRAERIAQGDRAEIEPVLVVSAGVDPGGP
jgi:hypothetical protein